MKGKVLFFAFALLIVCGSVFGILASWTSPQKTIGTIEMVQPCGYFWCSDYDSNYAQNVNRPNSEANKNNAQANQYNAEATAIVIDARQADNYTEFKGGAVIGYMGACFTMLILVVIAGFIWKYSGGG